MSAKCLFRQDDAVYDIVPFLLSPDLAQFLAVTAASHVALWLMCAMAGYEACAANKIDI